MEVEANSNSTQVDCSRLGKCEVCGFHDAKYTCPKCEVKTCSLKCNKIHKLEVECDGNRDKTKYVPINRFTNMDFESDYRLLESISERMDTIKKKRWESDGIPVHLLKLRSAALQRKTTLKFLPFRFVRHKNNTTQLNFKTNCIWWHIEWVFINADDLHFSDARVPETEKLGSALNKYLLKQNDPVLQEKLQYYQSAGMNGVKLLLKAEQKSGKKFYELDYTLTIRENLSRKLIIEYPTIYVLLKDHACGYDVIDSDDEEGGEQADNKTGNKIVEQILIKAESDESLYNSLKNLLFISEYSDEECLE